MGDEPFVVGTWHEDVHVVVPGYEALVAHCSDQTAGKDAIAQAVGLAGAVNGLQYA